MAAPRRIEPGPGQESVWDYPRPPRLEPSTRRVQVWVDGLLLADTTAAWRVLETYHPPTWYLPPGDVHMASLVPAGRGSFCEWKGTASYFDIVVGDLRIPRAVWTYPDPTPAFAPIRDHLAFYPAYVTCSVDGEPVQPQDGGFYGGWVTADVVGPFKGSPGMDGW